MAIMQEDIKFGVRTRKRNKSIKESAKLVLESMPQIPIHVAEIKKLILKDQISPDSSLNEDHLLNVLLSNSCGRNPTFFKAFGHNEVFGLKSSIPEGGRTVEIVERVPVEGTGVTQPVQYRQEGVLYVHLPDGHPVITGSAPSDDEAAGVAGDGACLTEDIPLDPLNMEAEVIIGESSPIQLELSYEETPVLISVEVEEEKKEPVPKEPDRLVEQPPVETLPARRHNLRPQRSNKHTAVSKQQVKRKKKPANLPAGIALPQRTTSRRSTLITGEIEIPFKPFPEELEKDPKTMKEVLGSIPGFNHKKIKVNKNLKKLSCAQMIQQTKEGSINLESPESILGQVNLRTLLNKGTFSKLPPLYQFKLIQLLPQTDMIFDESRGLRLNSSAFNNEFFAKACHEWRERLLRGDFTPEALQKCKSELDSDRRKLDPWKAKHFEPLWGMKKHYDLSKTVPVVNLCEKNLELNDVTEHSDEPNCDKIDVQIQSETVCVPEENLTDARETESAVSEGQDETFSAPVTLSVENVAAIPDEPLAKRRKLESEDVEPTRIPTPPLLLPVEDLEIENIEEVKVDIEETVELPVIDDFTEMMVDDGSSTPILVTTVELVDEQVEMEDQTLVRDTSKSPEDKENDDTPVDLNNHDLVQPPTEDDQVEVSGGAEENPAEDADTVPEDEVKDKVTETRNSVEKSDADSESEGYFPKYIDSRHSSSEDSIPAPLLISEETFDMENNSVPSAPPTLSPNGSYCGSLNIHHESEVSEMLSDDDKSDRTSTVESDHMFDSMKSKPKNFRLSLDSDSVNYRVSIDSCDSELEVFKSQESEPSDQRDNQPLSKPATKASTPDDSSRADEEDSTEDSPVLTDGEYSNPTTDLPSLLPSSAGSEPDAYDDRDNPNQRLSNLEHAADDKSEHLPVQQTDDVTVPDTNLIPVSTTPSTFSYSKSSVDVSQTTSLSSIFSTDPEPSLMTAMPEHEDLVSNLTKISDKPLVDQGIIPCTLLPPNSKPSDAAALGSTSDNGNDPSAVKDLNSTQHIEEGNTTHDAVSYDRISLSMLTTTSVTTMSTMSVSTTTVSMSTSSSMFTTKPSSGPSTSNHASSTPHLDLNLQRSTTMTSAPVALPSTNLHSISVPGTLEQPETGYKATPAASSISPGTTSPVTVASTLSVPVQMTASLGHNAGLPVSSSFQSIRTVSATSIIATPQTSASISSGPGEKNVSVSVARGNPVSKTRVARGTVNLQRSYEICKSVVEKSANRAQVENQLGPPPSQLLTEGPTPAKLKRTSPPLQTSTDANRPTLKGMLISPQQQTIAIRGLSTAPVQGVQIRFPGPSVPLILPQSAVRMTRPRAKVVPVSVRDSGGEKSEESVSVTVTHDRVLVTNCLQMSTPKAITPTMMIQQITKPLTPPPPSPTSPIIGSTANLRPILSSCQTVLGRVNFANTRPALQSPSPSVLVTAAGIINSPTILVSTPSMSPTSQGMLLSSSANQRAGILIPVSGFSNSEPNFAKVISIPGNETLVNSSSLSSVFPSMPSPRAIKLDAEAVHDNMPSLSPGQVLNSSVKSGNRANLVPRSTFSESQINSLLQQMVPEPPTAASINSQEKMKARAIMAVAVSKYEAKVASEQSQVSPKVSPIVLPLELPESGAVPVKDPPSLENIVIPELPENFAANVTGSLGHHDNVGQESVKVSQTNVLKGLPSGRYVLVQNQAGQLLSLPASQLLPISVGQPTSAPQSTNVWSVSGVQTVLPKLSSSTQANSPIVSSVAVSSSTSDGPKTANRTPILISTEALLTPTPAGEESGLASASPLEPENFLPSESESTSPEANPMTSSAAIDQSDDATRSDFPQSMDDVDDVDDDDDDDDGNDESQSEPVENTTDGSERLSASPMAGRFTPEGIELPVGSDSLSPGLVTSPPNNHDDPMDGTAETVAVANPENLGLPDTGIQVGELPIEELQGNLDKESLPADQVDNLEAVELPLNHPNLSALATSMEPARAVSAPPHQAPTVSTPFRPSSVDTASVKLLVTNPPILVPVDLDGTDAAAETLSQEDKEQESKIKQEQKKTLTTNVRIKPKPNRGNKMMLKSYGVPLLPKPPSMTQGSLNPCVCNMKAMIACQSCGAFCHDDCISANKLCFTCLIR